MSPLLSKTGSKSRSAALRRLLVAVLLAQTVSVAPAMAQGRAGPSSPATLTLADAISMAERGNPDYLSQVNDEGPATWAVRQAWTQLLLPQLATNLGLEYQAPGTPNLGGVFTSQDLGLGRTPAYYYSDYTLGLSYTLDAATLLGPSQTMAARRAVVARTDAARFSLVASVTQRYTAALQAQQAASLAAQTLARARSTAELAVARVQAGAAPPMDSLQGRLEEAQSEVTLVQAQTGRRTARLRLAEVLGRTLPRDVKLTSSFAVFEPAWTDAQLLEWARTGNPDLRADREDTRAKVMEARVARAAYLPKISVSGGVSGYTREAGDPSTLVAQAQASAVASTQSCQLMNEISAGLSTPLPGRPADCSRYAFTDTQRQQILQGNNAFPFSFSQQPAMLQVRISLPLFTGFSRQQQVSAANAAAEDARYAAMKKALQLTTSVEAAADSLRTLYITVQLEDRNRDLSAKRLELARERYRLGAGTFLELQQAETDRQTADRDYLNAQFDFQETLTALESLVGRRLRPGS